MSYFNFARWVKSLFYPRGKTHRKKSFYRLSLEELEARVTPVLYTWTGLSGIDNNWSTATNWSINLAPQPTAVPVELDFPSNASVFTANNDINNLIVDQLTIEGPTAPAYKLTGNQFTFANPVTNSATLVVNSGALGVEIQNPIQLGASGSNEAITVQSSASLKLSGQLTGVSGTQLSKDGVGLLTLAHDNSTFLGNFSINHAIAASGDAVSITDPNALGPGGATGGTTTITQNCQLQINLNPTGGTINTPLIVQSDSGPDGKGAIVMNT